MRLHPPLSEEEAYDELKAASLKEYGEEGTETLEPSLKVLAEALSAISQHPLPITVAPKFP